MIPSVAYTDPEVAWVGLTEDQARAQGIKVRGLFPWTASGRAIANGRTEGFTKLLFDDSPEAHGHGKILGGGIVGTHAGDMIGEIALAIEMDADAVDIGSPSTRTRPWARSAWRRKSRTAPAPTCRRAGSDGLRQLTGCKCGHVAHPAAQP